MGRLLIGIVLVAGFVAGCDSSSSVVLTSNSAGPTAPSVESSRRDASAPATSSVISSTSSIISSTSRVTPTTTPELTSTPESGTTSAAEDLRVLVFHKTAAFRHESIQAGIGALTDIGVESGFVVSATDDATQITDASLANYRVIVFLSTTGEILDPGQQEAMERFVAAGGGFVGIHSAADTEYDWPWYGELVGAWFDRHPSVQPASVDVLAVDHPTMAGLDAVLERTDEWYDFRTRPADDVIVLATVDESSYDGGGMGESHPIMWAHDRLGGRSFYTGFGHTVESYSEPVFRGILARAIEWAGG